MRSNHSEKVRRLYDDTIWLVSNFYTSKKVLAAHPGYWEAHIHNEYEAQSNMDRVVAERASIQPGEWVLDAGCGMGGGALWIAENCRARVFGVTLSPRQAQLAMQAAAQRRLSDQASFSLQDFTATAFPDGVFDVVWAIGSVCHVPAKASFFEEALRVLRPGGRLIVSDGFRHARGNAEVDEQLIQYWLEGWALPDADTVEEFVEAAWTAGFTDVRFDDVTDRIRPSVDRLHFLAHWSAPLCSALSFLRLLSPVVTQGMWANDAWYDVFHRGLWRYGFVTAAKAVM